MKMDTAGNILIKRVTKSNVYVKGWKSDDGQAHSSSAVSAEIIRANGLIPMDKALKLFDMKKFAANVNRELRRAYPDRRKLEADCISCVAFVSDSSDTLDLPSWVMCINIVALQMLRSKLPPSELQVYKLRILSLERIRLIYFNLFDLSDMNRRASVPNLRSMLDDHHQKSGEENPYSLPATVISSSTSSSRESFTRARRKEGHYASTGALVQPSRGRPAQPNLVKPPKLPPRGDFKAAKKANLSPIAITRRIGGKNKNLT